MSSLSSLNFKFLILFLSLSLSSTVDFNTLTDHCVNVLCSQVDSQEFTLSKSSVGCPNIYSRE